MLKAKAVSRLGLALALIPTMAGRASADIAVYDLTVSNMGSGFTGPFVQVQVNRTDSTDATITFTSLTNGGFEYLMHTNSAAAVNVSGSFSAPGTAGVTALPAPGGTSPTVDSVQVGSQNVDGMGSYNLVINLHDGSPPPSDAAASISFSISATAGNSWATATSVLMLNTGGGNGGPSVAAAQVGAWDRVIGDGFQNPTGYAGQSVFVPPNTAPEPSTMALAALGAMGFLGYGLRRLLKK